MVQHCEAGKHISNRDSATKKAQRVQKIQSSVKRMDNNAVGAHGVDKLDKFYRCGALYACARSNIPVDYIFDHGDWLGLHTKESLGHRSDL
eukprot:11621508-Ditylum_brightwellii.AAC.1